MTKTITLNEDVYERLKARKREDESFTELVNRLLDESSPDWREECESLSFGDIPGLEQSARESRKELGTGLADRQSTALEAMPPKESDDVENP